MEKLKMKNVIHIFGASGSGTTMARFCLSAFVRVATLHEYQYMSESALCHSAFVRVATQLFICKGCKLEPLPQRIRAGCDFSSLQNRISLSTLPQRIRAGCDCTVRTQQKKRKGFATAHSCGLRHSFLRCYRAVLFLCHSAFVRVATLEHCVYALMVILCHSAFVRVATQGLKLPDSMKHFATAHSCGLRPEPAKVMCCWTAFATAHSCGLRRG